jgi:CubicO group peptidase (beta-lactamase class C family)
MIANGGQLDGVRILSPKTVALMTTNQVGNLYGAPASGFGLGFSVNEQVGGDNLASVGSYGWGGAYASQYKVDPKEHLVLVFMINQLPIHTDIAGKFPTLVYQALVEPRM